MRTILQSPQDVEQAVRYVQALKASSRRQWVFEVKLYRQPRTGRQNRMYWAWLGMLAQETGNSRMDLHEYLKRKFLEPRTIMVRGAQVRLPGSTRLLDDKQFAVYLDKVSMWAADVLGILCASPGDLGFDTMMVQYGGEK